MSYQEILDETRQASRESQSPLDRTPASIGRPERVLELDVRFKTGDRWAFPYAYKTAIHFDLSGMITIYFSTHTVTIKGRNLGSLYAGLIGHTVAEIQESESVFDDSPEGQTVISAVDVQPLGRS